MYTNYKLQREQPVYIFKVKSLISQCINETTEANIFSIENKNALTLKETRNSFKKRPLNFRWITYKTVMEVGNIARAATCRSFLQLGY